MGLEMKIVRPCLHVSSSRILMALGYLVFMPGVFGTEQLMCNFDKTQFFLNCSSRGLTSVSGNEFLYKRVLGIDLSFNKISEIKNLTFANVSSLEALDLSDNEIVSLQPGAFNALVCLKALNLSGNRFTLTPDVFTPQLFEPLRSLREIHIQRYTKSGHLSWKGVDVAFSKLSNLTSLIMDFPLDFVFEKGFSALKQLRTIYAFEHRSGIGICDIRTIRNSTFRAFRNISVTEVRLIHCNIETIEANAFEPLKSLKTLDISHNQALLLKHALKSLYSLRFRNMSEICLSQINTLDCTKNVNQSILEYTDFEYLKTICVRSLDMSINYISGVDNSLRPKLRLDCLESFNMSYHSLRCIPLYFLSSFSLSKTLKVFDISYGFGVPKYDNYFPAYGVSNGHLSIDISAPPSLTTLNITAVAAWVNLGNITINSAANMREMDLAYVNLDNCDGSKVMGLDNLTSLDLSGIRCATIHPDFFLHFRGLTKLSLSNSVHINSILTSPALPFLFLDRLEEINLSGNNLLDLQPEVFRTNQQLRIINLSNNRFHRLPRPLYGMEVLERLDISSNSITDLHSNEMVLVDTWIVMATKKGCELVVDIGENPLQCNCQTVLFFEWLLLRRHHFERDGNLSCFLPNGVQTSVHEFWKNLADFKVKCVSQTYLVIAVVGSLTLVVMILVFFAIYRYRVNLRYWLYTKLKPPEDMFIGKEYVYDAFVAYTSDDYKWVFRTLRPNLELTDNPIRLCIHQKDFIPGKPIHENIVDKIRESRRILLVISRAFLESTYGPLEIEYAGMKCLEEGREDVIVCVLMEEIPVRQMPKALRNLWNKINFLKWSLEAEDQAAFWHNLKRALQKNNPQNP